MLQIDNGAMDRYVTGTFGVSSASAVCSAGVCQTPTCAPTCASGNRCGANNDRASNNCHSGVRQ